MDLKRYEGPAAAGVLGFAGFSLLSAWNSNAPSLSELRDAPPGDEYTRRKLQDAEYLVGGVAAVVGIAYAVTTHEYVAPLIMAAGFVFIASWHHSVLNANNQGGNPDERTDDDTGYYDPNGVTA